MTMAVRGLERGRVIGGWVVQRTVAERPWPEVKAERADGVQARLLVVPAPAVPDPRSLAAWRAALSPPWLDHPAFPALRGLGHDADAGALWIARAWSAWPSFAAVVDGATALSPGRRGAALVALGEALAALHGAGGCHGALALPRVLLARADGTACELLDLGLTTVAAGLGLRVAGALAPPEPDAGAAGDVHAFAAIVEAMLAVEGAGAAWHDRLAAWCRRIMRAAAVDRPGIVDALADLRPVLPAPEPAEPPPPPFAGPSARELAIMERVARERAAEVAAARATSGLRPPPPVVVDRDAPLVPPIVDGGPGVDGAAWLPMIRARRPAAAVRADEHEAGVLITGPASWRLGHGQRLAAAEAIADAVAGAIDALADGGGGGDLGAELRACGFTEVERWPGPGHLTRPGDARSPAERWWHRPGQRVVMSRAAVVVQQERQAWVTSHELGAVADDVVRLAGDAVPPRGEDRARLLAAMLAVAARIDDRPRITYVCRLCRGHFPGLRFHADLGACHRCSEVHLHIVH